METSKLFNSASQEIKTQEEKRLQAQLKSLIQPAVLIASKDMPKVMAQLTRQAKIKALIKYALAGAIIGGLGGLFWKK